MRILPPSRLRRGLLAITLLLPVLGTLGLVSPANAVTTTFTNTNPIGIPDSGPGNPSPSSVTVSGMGGVVTDVRLTLTNVSHSYAADIDAMLVSPTGQSLMVMSDVQYRGTRTLTFADGAATLGGGGSGTYAPTNLNDNLGGDGFTGGPAASGATTFAAAFDGIAPNGVWKLFVQDDAAIDSGSIGSWSLEITDSVVPQVITFSTMAPAPAHVGETYQPVATSDAGFPVTYSVVPAPATTNNACRLADDDQTLFFQHSGTCVVAADAPADATHLAGRSTQTITVVAAQSDLATLAISPIDASTTAGQPVHYSVQGKDSSGNPIPGQQATYSFAPTGGGTSVVCPSGDCAPATAGTYTVTATAPGKAGPVTSSTTLTVLADDVAALSISPEDSSTTAGTPVQFTVSGTDQFGNSLGNQTASSTIVATPVGGGTPVTCASGLCDLTVAGVWSVDASQPGPGAPASDATTLTVNPAALDRVEISPEDDTTVAGNPVVYTVTGFDEFDNVRTAGATVTATKAGVIITCPNGVCSPTDAGTWTITAANGSITDSTDLEVTAGPLADLVVSPDVTTVTPGTDVAYTATGADTYGNALGDRTSTSTFSLQRADGSGSAVPCPDAVCTAGAPGSYRVTATDGSVSGTATLVSALPSVSLELGALPTSTYGDSIPLSATVSSPDGTPAGSVQFGLDGNPVGSPVAVDGSGVATAPALTGVHAGVHTVTAAFTATPAGAYDSATTGQKLVVAQAPTTMKLDVTSSLTATVSSPAGTPDGSVTFAIDGASVGTVPLTGGTATWQGDNTGGADSVVTATYSGAADYLSSAVSTARKDPTVQAKVSGTARNGWYNQPVTVTFSCAPGSAPVACPDPVVIGTEGAGQTVTRTVVAADGGIAVVTTAPVSLDLTAPTARTLGVEAGRVYNGTAPDAACAATDALSGLESCAVTTSGERPGTVRTTVTATDLAGNATSESTTYSVRDLWVTRSEQVNGAWNVPIGGGRMLQLVDSGFPVVKAKGDLAAKAFRFAGRLDGIGHWTSRVRVPSGVRPGKILNLTIKRDDGSTDRVRIRAVRR